MHRLIMTLVLITAMSPTALLAQTSPTIKVEATKTIGAGSLNPPNPGEACNEAKKNAIDKAASAGFKGKVVWDKLGGVATTASYQRRRWATSAIITPSRPKARSL